MEENSTGAFVTQVFEPSDASEMKVSVTYSFLPGSPLKVGFLVEWLGGETAEDVQLTWRISSINGDYYTYAGALVQMQTESPSTEILLKPSTGKAGDSSIGFYHAGKEITREGYAANQSGCLAMKVDWGDAGLAVARAALDPAGKVLTLTFGNFTLSRSRSICVDPTITTKDDLDDASVAEEAPHDNFGSSEVIQTRLYKEENGTIFRYRFYIKFSLVSLPAGASISSAKIYLYLYLSSSQWRYIGAHYAADNSWTEEDITWQTRPDFTASATAVTWVSTGAGWFSWSVTADARQGFLSNQKRVFSECFKDEYETSGVPTVPSNIRKIFYSKEATASNGTLHPYLQVAYTLKAFAVLVASGWDRANNKGRYYNDIMFMYDTLKDNYNYTDSQIYVLYCDGCMPTTDTLTQEEYDLTIKNHENVIDFPATPASMQYVFTSIAGASDSETFIFVFMAGHGDRNNTLAHSYFCAWGADISDQDFNGSNYLGKITSYSLELIVMGQCYSGGFINWISNSKRVIYAACSSSETSWPHDGNKYDEFLYYFVSALHGETPDGKSVNADKPEQELTPGTVVLYEVYKYADEMDTIETQKNYPSSGYQIDWYTTL
ncbi:MAG: DNRLRE domain-containing protein [Promethearchaeati archaeon SRVP18_Atabeyarchaeia-1]